MIPWLSLLSRCCRRRLPTLVGRGSVAKGSGQAGLSPQGVLAYTLVSGVSHAVSAKYLQDYLNEYAFRYNRRGQEEPMFESFLAQVPISGQGE